jgi:hypothetical protein
MLGSISEKSYPFAINGAMGMDRSSSVPVVKKDRIPEEAPKVAASGIKGEIRKTEVCDGELSIKVYDSSGKLVRKIPPGYLPAGEQQFDITV